MDLVLIRESRNSVLNQLKSQFYGVGWFFFNVQWVVCVYEEVEDQQGRGATAIHKLPTQGRQRLRREKNWRMASLGRLDPWWPMSAICQTFLFCLGGLQGEKQLGWMVWWTSMALASQRIRVRQMEECQPGVSKGFFHHDRRRCPIVNWYGVLLPMTKLYSPITRILIVTTK